MTRRNHSFTVMQATLDSPTFARLSELAAESSARLKEIQALIPEALRAGIQAGPIEGLTWCLVLDNNAIASKMRQLIPALESHLRSKGWEVENIRLKVLMSRSSLK
jgi:hypothetical protein